VSACRENSISKTDFNVTNQWQCNWRGQGAMAMAHTLARLFAFKIHQTCHFEIGKSKILYCTRFSGLWPSVWTPHFEIASTATAIKTSQALLTLLQQLLLHESLIVSRAHAYIKQFTSFFAGNRLLQFNQSLYSNWLQ